MSRGHWSGSIQEEGGEEEEEEDGDFEVPKHSICYHNCQIFLVYLRMHLLKGRQATRGEMEMS